MSVEPIVRTAKVEPPVGYSKIEGGLICRCLRVFKAADGAYWCCNARPEISHIGKASADSGHPDAGFIPVPDENSKVVELVTAPEQAAALKEKLEHALHDVCAVLDQIEAAGLHGSFNLGKGQYWNIAAMTVAKHF